MRRKIAILLSMAMLFAMPYSLVFGQTTQNVRENVAWCGSVFSDEQMDQLDAFVDYYYNRGGKAHYQANGRALKYVPIAYHLVANTDGSGRYPLSDALSDLCITNADMQHADIQFYLGADINMSINNTGWNNGTGSGTPPQYTLMPQVNNVNNTVNVYQVAKIRNESNVLGVAVGSTTAFFNQGAPTNNSMILVKKGQAGNDQTLAHEFGHNFSLAHTFYGWEGANDYVCGSLASALYEKYDGSNCTTAGDRFCDTEPDYIAGGFNCTGSSNQSNCLQMDADSMTGFANGSNIMSYGFGCSNRAFTTDQINSMDFQLNTFRQNLLGYTPTTTAITTAPVLDALAPFFYDNVTLSWSAAPNATHYAIEICNLFPNFSEGNIVDMAVVQGTSYTTTLLQPDYVYYWRVIPFNEGYFCANPTAAETFNTGSTSVSTRSIAAINDVVLQPNVANNSQRVNLLVNASEGFDADIRIFNTQGQAVREDVQQRFTQGTTIHALNTNGLSAGIYIVAIQTTQGVINKKLVITQ